MDFDWLGAGSVCGGGGGGGGLSESVEKLKMTKIFFTDNIQ